jgi:hypothetical protein
VRDAGLGAQRFVIEDGNSGSFTSGARRCRDRYQRLDRTGHGLTFTDGRIYVIKEFGWPATVKVCSLSGVDCGTAANCDEGVVIAGGCKANRILKRFVTRLDAHPVEDRKAHLVTLQRFERRDDGRKIAQVRIGENQNVTDAKVDHIGAHFAGCAKAEADGGCRHFERVFMLHPSYITYLSAVVYLRRMKKLFAALFVFAFCLSAADFWQSKPSTEWGDKDLQKMITNSPWARPFTVSMPAGGAGGDAGGPPPMSEGRGGRGGGGGGGGGSVAPAAIGGLAPTFYARWQSALPVKQAFVRLKYGAQAGTASEAKKVLEREEPDYVVVVSGPLRSLLRGDPETLKKAIMDASSLSAKGKDAVKASEVQMALKQEGNDMVFHFARSAPFTVDDKEVEFSTRFGEVTLKFKFKLKDMVYNGKLEM